MVTAVLHREHALMERSDPGLVLWQKGWGTLQRSGVKLSLYETLFLHETERVTVMKVKRACTDEEIVRAGRKHDGAFWTKYCVFRDLRGKGYLVKTALKFGADFRVYEKGAKQGEQHAKWIVYPVRESERFSWYDFSAKNRVAHSTRKNLLIAVVDDEDDVTYFEVSWTRP